MSSTRRRRPRRPGDAALKRIAFAWLAGAAVIASLAGCGGGGTRSVMTATPQLTSIRVYFLRAGRVQPVHRTVHQTSDLATAALEKLAAGPTPAERKDLGLTSVVQETEGITFSGSEAHVPTFDRASLAQIVYTLTQFPAIRTIAVGDMRYTRKDFEDETPIILVESPLPFQTVTTPLHATGTANTFEATFQYDLVDPGGKLLKTHFVTATSGTGTRGTFDFSVPFKSGSVGMGKLVVYELSAKDGSRIHETAIPVRMTA
jgi:germination protein M